MHTLYRYHLLEEEVRWASEAVAEVLLILLAAELVLLSLSYCCCFSSAVITIVLLIVSYKDQIFFVTN